MQKTKISEEISYHVKSIELNNLAINLNSKEE